MMAAAVWPQECLERWGETQLVAGENEKAVDAAKEEKRS